MYDMHIHTNCSHDCNQTIDIMCTSASERGLRGIAICNHADMGPCDVPGSYEDMCRCAAEVEQARRNYSIDILQGIEMAEQKYDPEKAKKILGICDYDVILGSVHYVEYMDITTAYSRVDFSGMSEDRISGFIEQYFCRITDMIDNTDIDVLAHLTCPVRYINGKYNMNYDVMKHRCQIKDILHSIIRKSIALEVNTSGIGTTYGDYIPQGEILQIYGDMGGRLVTVASDAHTPDRVGFALDEALDMIKHTGIDSYCYYKGRKPQTIKI